METVVLESEYGSYDYEIWEYPDDDYPSVKYYFYTLLPNNSGGLQSNESFETLEEARFAAIGHIDILEKGKS